MTGSSSYEERHSRAADTFSVFAPDVEPERVASSMARRLGALGSFAFDVVGEMWARPDLSRRDRSLIVVSTLAAQARDEELELHTGVALRNGLTRTEIEELVVTVAAYAGFPAAMAASRRVDTALRAAADVEQLEGRHAAAAKSDAERDRHAAEVIAGMTGAVGVGDPETVLASLEEALGGVGVLASRWAFGEVWARPELGRRDRSLAVIAILTSLGTVDELRFHVPAGLRHGLTGAEVEAAITHLALYAGFPRAVEAMRVARAAIPPPDEAAGT
jgi:4-carboxymuconolactone decarboxylase